MQDPKKIADSIRDKVFELNRDLIEAAEAEVDVEFVLINSDDGRPSQIMVWCSQEVR